MPEFPKPRILVSRCLGFEACRYNGESLQSDAVEELRPFVEFLPVCPEMDIGLGVPREPVRLVLREGAVHLVQPATGEDRTEAMREFSSTHLSGLGEVDGFLLKYRSPSCGPANVKIYHSDEKGAGSSRGSGLFAEAVGKRFPDHPLEDEGRLNDFVLREAFLTAIFALARFRKARESGIHDILKFHSRNKLLLMGAHQSKMREMGRLLASYKKGPTDGMAEAYEVLLRQALKRPVQAGPMINVLQHAFGGLSERLSSQEKAFFLKAIEEYRDERIPLSVLNTLLLSWAVRFEEQYLLDQTFLCPFPAELVTVRDSGKGTRR